MDLYEVEGKEAFSRYGIETDSGVLLARDDDIPEICYPCVVKAQVLCGHRGQQGGIKVAKDRDELCSILDRMYQNEFEGEKVRYVLIVPFLRIIREHYLGITLDTVNRKRVMLYSSDGGMNIENTMKYANTHNFSMDVTENLDEKELAYTVMACGIDDEIALKIAEYGAKLYKMYLDLDATTAEINPLAELDDGRILAADSKVSIDDNALYRQTNLTKLPRMNTMTEI